MVNRKWSIGSPGQWEMSSGTMAWRRTYPGRGDQVAAARQFAASLLAGTGRADEVEFIVTELVSNALRHTRSGQARGWFALEVALDELAYVAVTDLGGGGRPVVLPENPPDALYEGGRGLLAVSRLSLALGIHGSPEGGHTVWADLSLSNGQEINPDRLPALVG